MSKTVSIRSRLLTNLTLMVIVMGGAILATTFIGARRAVRSLAGSIVGKTEDVVVAQLDAFFNAPVHELAMTRGQLMSGVLAAGAQEPDEERDRVNAYLSPIIDALPQISSIMLADDRGREHMLLRTSGQWQSRVTRIDDWGNEVRRHEWSPGVSPRSNREVLDYDPRARPWFTGAIEARERDGDGTVYWTEPYTFFTTKEPGITASVAYEIGDGVEHVVGFDVLLKDISRFTLQRKVGERGMCAVLTEDRRLLGLPQMARFDDPEARAAAYLKMPEELGLALVTDAAAAMGQASLDEGLTARFESGGEAWWGRVTAYELSPRQRLRVAVVIPEAELLGNVRAQRTLIIGIVLAVLAVALARAVFLARRFSAPVEALAGQSERISAGDFSEGEPIRSNVTEIRRLAEAQDELRTAVQAQIKLDKVERELDLAREIQRGLMPDSAPDLPGFEIAGWNQAADQTGGDYFDWLQLPTGRTIMTLADVTGHGIAPALIVSVCRAYLRAAASESANISEAVGWVNDLLFADTPPERFVTAAVGVLDPQDARMRLISAGHGPNLFYEAATGTVHDWHGDTPPLGVIDGLQHNMPAPREIQFKSGDVLVLTTDGFFEWMNAEREQFGTERLTGFVRDHHDMKPREFIAALYQAVLDFAQGTDQADDLTALVLKKL